jgi:hypothetical protein
MSAEHTPGPWSISRAHPSAIVGGKIYQFTNGSGQRQVAMACVMDEDNGSMEANARLIAAAPDLLDAARAALDDLISDGHEHYRVAEVLRAAIAKATGGSHG